MKAFPQTLMLIAVLLGASLAGPMTTAFADPTTFGSEQIRPGTPSKDSPSVPLEVNDSPIPSTESALCPTCECTLTVDHPHQSATNPHAVNVHSRVKCKKSELRIRATADLYRFSLWQWEKVAHRDDVTTHGKDYAKASSSSWDGHCVSGDYKGVGSGYVDLADGTKLSSTHETLNTVTCH